MAGKNWTSTEGEKADLTIPDPRYLCVAYNDGARPVVFRYIGLRPDARYVLRVFYYNIQHDRPLRVQTLSADDSELHGPLELPHGQEIVRTFELRPALYRDAAVTLSFRKVTGLNAIVSAIAMRCHTHTLSRMLVFTMYANPSVYQFSLMVTWERVICGMSWMLNVSMTGILGNDGSK